VIQHSWLTLPAGLYAAPLGKSLSAATSALITECPLYLPQVTVARPFRDFPSCAEIQWSLAFF
jgi:hypothetical protein